MSQMARVKSIETLQDWKNALVLFRESAQDALSCVELEIRKMFDWLDDQRKFWEAEVRRREDQVTQAKSDLFRRKLLPTASGKSPDTTEQQKALRKAQLRLEEAQDKLEKSRRWVVQLRRAVDEYQTQGRRLTTILEGELPRSTAHLEQRINALEAYVAMTARAAEPRSPSPTVAPAPPAEARKTERPQP